MTIESNRTLSDASRRTIVGRLRVVSVFIIAGLGSGVAMAEWHLDPILRIGWDFDDNATLAVRTDEEEEISGYIGEASVGFAYDSDKGDFSLRPMARSRRYSSNLDRDADDQFMYLNTGYDGQSNTLRISADYSREEVRTAELADAELDADIDPDDIANDESGRIGISQRRERFRVRPRWAYRMSDVSTLEADVNFLTVDYVERQAVTNLFDYTTTRLRLSYRRQFSERNTGVLRLAAYDYETERFGGDSTGYGITAGFNRDISETTHFRAHVGVTESKEEDIGQGTVNSDPNIVADISLTKRLKTVHLLAQYRQQIAPSGRGELTRRNEFNLRFTRDLNEKISAGLGVRAYTVDSIDGSTNEQDYVQLRGQFTWRISRAFSMQTNYRYTILTRAVLGESANSNRVTVWLSYRPNPRGR